MSQVLKVNLPDGAQPAQEEMKEITNELKGVEGVKFASSSPTRGGELQALTTFIQVMPTVLTAVSTALPMLQKIGGVFHKKGLKGVVVEGPGGIKISLDKASPEDVQRLVDAMKGMKTNTETPVP